MLYGGRFFFYGTQKGMRLSSKEFKGRFYDHPTRGPLVLMGPGFYEEFHFSEISVIGQSASKQTVSVIPPFVRNPGTH